MANNMYINPKTIKNIKDPRTGKYYSEADLQAWTTRLTKTKIDQGKQQQRKYTKAKTKGKKYNTNQSRRTRNKFSEDIG